MPNTKLMREALEAIAEFWNQGDDPISPYAWLGASDEIIREKVFRALNTDEDALPDQNEGDVHVYKHRQTNGRALMEFDLRTDKAIKWWDDLDHPLKHAVNLIAVGNNFRAQLADGERIFGMMEASGLEVRDYR